MRKLVLAGLVAAGVVAYRRRTAATPGPTLVSVPPRPDTATPSATAGSHLHPVRGGRDDTAPVFPGDDQGASSPDEAAADLVSEAERHAVTLPDQPLEEVDLTDVPDPVPPTD